MKPLYTYLFFFQIFVLSVSAQSTDSLYRLADTFYERFGSKYYYNSTNVRAVNDAHAFVYLSQTPKGREFYLIDIQQKTQKSAFDQERLAASLSKVLNKETDPYNLPFQQFRFNNRQDSIFFRIGTTDYYAALGDYNVAMAKEQSWRRDTYWSTLFKEDSKERVASPDRKKEAYISEGNLWVRDRETGKSRKLSDDGSPYEYYSSNIYWSPDSRKIVCCKYRPGADRQLTLISSSPQDQLQPKIETLDYLKPGDALPIRRPVAFLLEEEKVIPFDVPEVDSQYDLNNIKWDKGSDFFTFDFNKRGHQQFIIYAGDIQSEALRPVIKEESPTFIYYYNLYQYWFKDSPELLWISERDGWRHLYLYDVLTGKVKKQLTKGEWVVKSVENVDEKNRRLIFKGCGMDENEDPYLEKYYTLDMNNGKITALTPENAQHNVTFTKDYKYIFDLYSRVDLAPTMVVRSVEDKGKIVYKPEIQPDISKVVDAGWRMPEVFSAKGRDGKTDIWGVIIRPSNFDPAKKYPVIEYIYAGPHDSHVPKSFAVEQRTSALSEMGFITVMIDGMGTANRSKAFHDVCWKNLNDAGFPDRIAWLKTAAEKYPEIDIERMGIYGMSAGGQNTMSGLLSYPDFYKVGVASCGCYDNRMDKIWWNEQWMGYPIGKHYEENSNVVNAHLLKGKLLLLLGEMDNNVDPSSTLQLVNELIKHDKEFEFVMLPGARHTMGEKYGERKRRDFFVKHLLGKQTPEWNR